MKVTSNNGSAVVIEATADEASTLAGRQGFTDAIALQDQLQEALADSWYGAASRRPRKVGAEPKRLGVSWLSWPTISPLNPRRSEWAAGVPMRREPGS